MVRQKPKGSGNYYYQFMVDNKNYHGTCKGCTTKRSAEKYEREIRQTILKASSQKTVRALIENFRDELTGGSTAYLKFLHGFKLGMTELTNRICDTLMQNQSLLEVLLLDRKIFEKPPKWNLPVQEELFSPLVL